MKVCVLCSNYIPIRTADKPEGSCILKSETVPSFSSCEDGFKSISLKKR